jgi:hypothetical protein
MKVIGIASTAILSLLLAIAPAYAQQGQGEKQDHPEQQQSKHEQSKPEQQHTQQPQRAQPPQEQHQSQQQLHPQQQEQNQNKQPLHAQQEEQHQNQQQLHPQQQVQNQNQQQQHVQQHQQDQSRQQQHAQQQRANEQPQRTQEQQRVQQSAWQQHRAQSWQSDHRNWQQRGGYHGYRIPDDRFRGYFGPEHGFRIYGLPFLVVGGYPRFQYGGYWLSPVDPWPEYWANNWYDTDDVYIAYADNGYYLFNRRYPNVGIAISISV